MDERAADIKAIRDVIDRQFAEHELAGGRRPRRGSVQE